MQLFERLKTHVKRARFTLSERIHKHVRALCKFKESKGFKHQCQLFGGAALACGLVAATLLNPLFSQAKPINLAGGGTIDLHPDGTITGICYSELDLSAVRAGRHAEFYITMPDGATLRTYCLNHGQAAPADGNVTIHLLVLLTVMARITSQYTHQLGQNIVYQARIRFLHKTVVVLYGHHV